MSKTEHQELASRMLKLQHERAAISHEEARLRARKDRFRQELDAIVAATTRTRDIARLT